MIRFPCDRCERLIAAAPEQAGAKVECPDCGDVNIVPARPAASGAGDSAPAVARSADAATAPPLEDGRSDEQRVLLVRPSLVRKHPIAVGLLLLAPIAVAVLGRSLGWSPMIQTPWLWWFIFPAIGWVALAAWWFHAAMFRALEVTSRRASLVDGLVFRSRRDVFHRDIQSVTVRQSGWDFILNVGDIEISSDENSDGAPEIRLEDVGRPRAVKAKIEQFVPRFRRH